MSKKLALFWAVIINMIVLIVGTANGAEYSDGYYEWIFNKEHFLIDESGQKYFSETTGRNNAFLDGKVSPTFSNNQARLYNRSFFNLDKPVILDDNKNWRVEWKGKMESGTTYNCETIFGNKDDEQYIMYGSNNIFFGINSSMRAELPCNRDTVAYKDTSYVLECDGNRHLRLSYQVMGTEQFITGQWTDYPAEVNDLSFNALFGSYQNILYKGYIEYLRVWEEFPDDFNENPMTIFDADLKVIDGSGNEIFGTKSDFEKSTFYLTGKIMSTARKNTSTLRCILAAFDEKGILKNAGLKEIVIPAKSTVELSKENGVSLEGVDSGEGMNLKIFVLNEQLKPAMTAKEILFDGKFVGSIKMLSIGNSYSIDASTMVHDIAAADGVDINILNLHIGGCTLQTHWENAQSGAKVYASQLNGVSAGTVSMQEALAKENWDYISFQQGSHESNDFSTYWTEEKPYLTNLSEYVKNMVPHAEQIIHQTWAYQNQRAIDRLGYTGAAPDARNAMFADVKAAYKTAAEKIKADILPCGEAVQYAQNVLGFTEEQIYRDGYSHLTEDKGRYLAAAVWYISLTGNSIMNNTFRPQSVSDNELMKLKQAAEYAVNLQEYKRK